MSLWHWWITFTSPGHPLGWFFSVSGRWYAVTSGIGIGFAMRLANRGICHEPGCCRPAFRTTLETSGEHVPRCRKHHGSRHDR